MIILPLGWKVAIIRHLRHYLLEAYLRLVSFGSLHSTISQARLVSYSHGKTRGIDVCYNGETYTKYSMIQI